MDRAGKASSSSVSTLTDMVRWDFLEQNCVSANGQIWSSSGCIPMGGSFSAPVADLYSVWKLYTMANLMKNLGDLSSSDSVYPVWTLRGGRNQALKQIGMAQFCDKVLVALPAEADSASMELVFQVLSKAWDFPVLCTFGDGCKGLCLTRSITAVGVRVVWPGNVEGAPLVHLQPSSLNDSRQVKCTPGFSTTLSGMEKPIRPGTAPTRMTSNIWISVECGM